MSTKVEEQRERMISRNMALALLNTAKQHSDTIIADRTGCEKYLFLLCESRGDLERIIQVAGAPATYRLTPTNRHFLIYNTEVND